MKKQQLTSTSLKFNKTNIANLDSLKGRGPNLSAISDCHSKLPTACHTITVRPDSIDM